METSRKKGNRRSQNPFAAPFQLVSFFFISLFLSSSKMVHNVILRSKGIVKVVSYTLLSVDRKDEDWLKRMGKEKKKKGATSWEKRKRAAIATASIHSFLRDYKFFFLKVSSFLSLSSLPEYLSPGSLVQQLHLTRSHIFFRSSIYSLLEVSVRTNAVSFLSSIHRITSSQGWLFFDYLLERCIHRGWRLKRPDNWRDRKITVSSTTAKYSS